ncbi:hypothetical protein [Cellulomonas triticagri]|uniref:Uncharacterized protein n=1 Tax=Cellulomonas triticagri TaxID=2483352 RepID=A0A3M2JAV6_9CELL|nr:hypothetical protein [Cellulomonas triticagri]RMI09281.1 hypothetical protein EBM89_10965 [Cellulomonas triticagri]
MPSADYFLTSPSDDTRRALSAAFQEHGFEVTTSPDGSWAVARGNATLTAFVGAWAGRRRQRLVYAVRFFDHQGTPVARFERESGAGVMGGAIGVSRSNDVFTEVSAAVAERLHQQGHLVSWVRGA